MNGLQLLNDYPKAAIVVKQWYLDKMLENINDESIPDDFKELVRQQSLDDERVSKFIDSSYRTLFDVFDNHKIYIQVSVLVEAPKFWYSINGADSRLRWDDRREAEKYAVFEAFKLLNDKL